MLHLSFGHAASPHIRRPFNLKYRHWSSPTFSTVILSWHSCQHEQKLLQMVQNVEYLRLVLYLLWLTLYPFCLDRSVCKLNKYTIIYAANTKSCCGESNRIPRTFHHLTLFKDLDNVEMIISIRAFCFVFLIP